MRWNREIIYREWAGACMHDGSASAQCMNPIQIESTPTATCADCREPDTQCGRHGAVSATTHCAAHAAATVHHSQQ